MMSPYEASDEEELPELLWYWIVGACTVILALFIFASSVLVLQHQTEAFLAVGVLIGATVGLGLLGYLVIEAGRTALDWVESEQD